MTERINGFIILKKSFEDDETYGIICRLGDKEYRGIARPGLESLFEEFREQKSPKELDPILRQSNYESNDSLFFKLFTEYSDALKVMKYVTKENVNHELIAIYSDVITNVRGVSNFEAKPIEWLGYDVYMFGGSSLILEGIFFKPEYFYKWIEALNINGLFPGKKGIDDFIKDYLECVKENIVEYYDPSRQLVDTIRVGRVLQ